jgi:hypothetical protein
MKKMIRTIIDLICRIAGISMPCRVVFVEKPPDPIIVKEILNPAFVWVLSEAKNSLAKAVSIAKDAEERNAAALRLSGADYVAYFADAFVKAAQEKSAKAEDLDINLAPNDLVKSFEQKHGKVRFE